MNTMLLLVALAVAQDPAPEQLPPPVHKVCVPVPETKKVPHVFYSCKEEEFCLPRCPGFSFFPIWRCWLGHGCRAAEEKCPECGGKIHTRRKLVKTIVIEEKQVLRCKPQCVPQPACDR